MARTATAFATSTSNVTGTGGDPRDEFEALAEADVLAGGNDLQGWTLALSDQAAGPDPLMPAAERAVDVGLLALQLGFRPPPPARARAGS